MTIATAIALTLPLAGLLLLLAEPDADARWEHHPSHFWLVLGTAVVAALLAWSVGSAARQRDDAVPRQADDAEHWRGWLQTLYRREAFVTRYGVLPYVEDLVPDLASKEAQPPSVAYVETGKWFISRMRRSGLGDDFLMTGYAGKISFTVRAVGLVRQIRSADIRVAVKMTEPFTRRNDVYKVYDVRWNARRSLWNAAVRTWPNFDEIEVSGPIQWIARPREQERDLTATAYVLSVTTTEGKQITFAAPEFVPTGR